MIAGSGLTIALGGHEVLDGVDLHARDGEVLVVLGANGSGKSTLLRVLAGLLRPDAGEIRRDGRCVLALQTPALSSRSARANVVDALRWWGVERSERGPRAEWALAALGAGELAGRRTGTLSGGQARRVHLARALAVRAETMMLDEPFAGLDPQTRGDLIYDVGTVLRDERRATILVLQDLGEALALGDRMVILVEGRAVADGSPRELLERPPTPEVARFLGYRGAITEPGGTRYLRVADVELDSDGPIEGRVVHTVPIEEGVRVELESDGGGLAVHSPLPGPRIGELVRVRVSGGVRFSDD